MSTYEALVQARKSCRRCPDLVNPSDPSHTEFDGTEIGPWTRWLAARPARLTIVGQDWGTVDFYRRYGGIDPPGNATNRKLMRFLGELGFDIPPAGSVDMASGVFLTNAYLCLKQGASLSAPVRSRWFENCSAFLRDTINLSGAPNVICLGVRAYSAVAAAFDIVPYAFIEAVEGAVPLKLLTA